MQQKATAKFRIEVFYKKDDPRGSVIRDKFQSLGYPVNRVFIADNYLLNLNIVDNILV